ncbi:hypothetical protein PspKH34_02040 [Parageobacillus sp. KH3-4]|nr:hypothetical protein PspKH34_02040 [Parageobacillus sp. KH3-4]
MRSNLIQVRNMARTLLLLIFISTMGACGKYPDEINMGAHTSSKREFHGRRKRCLLFEFNGTALECSREIV